MLIENCTAVVLTGGESRRMGADKAMTEIAGKPMAAHIVETLDPLFSDILISVREFRTDVTLPQVIDRSSERGPMVGIKSALEAVQTDWLFVIACDMPFVSAELIHHLASERGDQDANDNYDVILPYVCDRPQPLFGFYAKKRCLPMMEIRLAAGQRSMMRLLDQLNTYYLPEEQVKQIDPQLRSSMSLDTLEEVKKMESNNE